MSQDDRSETWWLGLLPLVIGPPSPSYTNSRSSVYWAVRRHCADTAHVDVSSTPQDSAFPRLTNSIGRI